MNVVKPDALGVLSKHHLAGHGGGEREGLSEHHHKLHPEGHGHGPRGGEQHGDTVGAAPASQAQVWVKERSPT